MVRRKENRRVLAVDDDEATLDHYRQIFTRRKTGSASAANQRLLQPLEGGLERSPSKDEQVSFLDYQFDCFTQGKEAVEAVRQAIAESKPYAVALIDMRMLPGIDGLETARRIRQLDEVLQIIFITAYSDYGTGHIFQEIGGPVFWFRKPFETEQMYTTVRSCCDAWNQAHELSLLCKDLADRVDLQTERLQAKVQSVMVLQNNSLKRELMMGDMKRELRSLKAYQDLRLLLKDGQLSEPRPLNSELEPVQLLLVDDSPTVRAINKSRLEEVGFAVQVAESVDQAFRLAEKFPFEVALIDFYMPGGNGDKLISMLRSDPNTMYILPLLFTNAGDEMMAVESGAVYWMTKDQPQFILKMELLRDYIQDNRSFQQSTQTLKQLDSNRRVLLVDDDWDNLDSLSDFLRDDAGREEATLEELARLAGQESSNSKQTLQEFEVTTCQQGEMAIIAVREAQFEERPYAVAMIDMRMPPGMNGLETARQIRQLSPQIDIIIMSAYSDHTVGEIRAVLGDNFSFLSKPFRTEEVVQRVVEGCAKWAMVREVNASHHALLNLADDMDKENVRRREAEQKLADTGKALEQEKIYMDEIFSSMREPLLVVGHDGNIQGCNTALLKLIESSRESVVAQPVDSLCKQEDADGLSLIDHIQQLFQMQLQQVHNLDEDAFHRYMQESEIPLLVVEVGATSFANSTIFMLSAGGQKLFGFDADEVEGKPLSLLLPVEGIETLEQMARVAKGSACRQSSQLPWKCADGTTLSASLCMVYIRCGEHHHYIVHLNTEENKSLFFMDDFSEVLSYSDSRFFINSVVPQIQQELIEVLRENYPFESYCRNFPLPLALSDESGEMVSINSAMEQLSGWERSELVGAPFTTLLPKSLNLPDVHNIKEFLASPAVQSLEEQHQFPLLTSAGDKVLVEIGLIPIKLEGRLHFLAALFAPTNPEPLEVFKATRSEIFSLSKDELLMGDRQLRVNGGQTIPVAVSGSLLHNLDQGVNGVVLMLHDLRERQKAEQREQYAAFQSGVAEMTVNILHNIGNTIQGMDSASSDISRQLADIRKIQDLYERFGATLAEAEDERAREAVVEKVLEAGRRLPQVLQSMQESWAPSVENIQVGIDHIKEVVRLQQRGDEISIQHTRFSLGHLFDDLQLLTNSEIKKRDINLILHTDEGSTMVKLPRNQLIQAMINLIKNSAESIEEQMFSGGLERGAGVIDLSARVSAKELMIVVKDNGAGIDPAISDNLLRFGFTTKINGSGFGLHATGNFVNANGGAITLESGGVGQGCTTILRLPVEGS